VELNVIDWLFRNRQTGKITIAQFPNLALWIFIAAVAERRLAGDSDNLETIADYTASAALVWWGIDEIARGVNPWRRMLGVVAAGLVAFRLVRSV
jgi:hypothetical protein